MYFKKAIFIIKNFIIKFLIKYENWISFLNFVDSIIKPLLKFILSRNLKIFKREKTSKILNPNKNGFSYDLTYFWKLFYNLSVFLELLIKLKKIFFENIRKCQKCSWSAISERYCLLNYKESSEASLTSMYI